MPDKNEWKKFFDEHAPKYMENVFTSNTAAEVDFIIRELALSGGERILDVGCGTGRHAVGLARRGYKVTGLDLSAGMLAEARKAAEKVGVEIELVETDASDFELNRLFDAAICLCEGAFGLLGSADDPAEHDLAILRNIYRSLKPGGRFLLTALNGFKLVRQYGDKDVASGRLDPVYLSERYDVEYDTLDGKKSLRVTERGFAPSELLLMLRMTGFTVDHIGGGTAGNWGKRPIELDEYELMVIAHKAATDG
ncbi:MAG: methyltransferase domain-containing protein [Candidatus Zixiibacteriota bacterium]|nr:MAG: methyltransferase domain-containing protein [candidate division Zixibacteria bacterium]